MRQRKDEMEKRENTPNITRKKSLFKIIEWIEHSTWETMFHWHARLKPGAQVGWILNWLTRCVLRKYIFLTEKKKEGNLGFGCIRNRLIWSIYLSNDESNVKQRVMIVLQHNVAWLLYAGSDRPRHNKTFLRWLYLALWRPRLFQFVSTRSARLEKLRLVFDHFSRKCLMLIRYYEYSVSQ